MTPLRTLLCFVAPPLAVMDRGSKAIVLTSALSIAGWIPGIIAALVYSSDAPNEPYWYP